MPHGCPGFVRGNSERADRKLFRSFRLRSPDSLRTPMSRDCDRSCTGFSGGDHRRAIGSAPTLSARPPRRTAWSVGDNWEDWSSPRCNRNSRRWSSVWPAVTPCRRRSCLGRWRRSFYQTNPTRAARPGVAWCLSRPARFGFHALPPAVRAAARELGVRDWLIAAATSGELSTTQTARLERCGGFARALKTGDVRVVAATEWPNVLPEERGKIVSQILEHVAITSEAQQRKLLAACVSAWPDGLRPGAGPERHRDGPRQDALVGFV